MRGRTNMVAGGGTVETITGTLEFSGVIRCDVIYANTGGGGGSVSSYVTRTTDYIFLLSEYEVFGTITNGNTYEANYQQQYAYYSAGNSKIKYRHNSTGRVARWWLRSPSAGNSDRFVIVGTDGAVYSNVTNNSLGFAPGFCV